MAVSGSTREEVHQALEALHDNVRLAEAELARRFPLLAGIPRLEERADRARALLLEAIEVLRPARAVPFGSDESRLYDILSLRYVENLSLPEVMQELSLSRRQAYRDLADAEERLARVLDSWASAPIEAPAKPRRDLISEELASLPDASDEVDLITVAVEAAGLVRGLAEQLGIVLQLPPAPAPPPPPVLVDRTLLRQVLVQLFSAVLQSRPRESVEIQCLESGDTVSLALTFVPEALKSEMLDTVRMMAESQHLGWTIDSSTEGTLSVSLSARCGRLATVLVIEDNPGVVELYHRYLAPSGYRVVSAPTAAVAFEVARRTQPDAVVLDILLPGQDGWSIMKALREHHSTRHIPVIICSVLEDPSLASSLGADAYLSKPVTQWQLLRALSRCLTASSGSVAGTGPYSEGKEDKLRGTPRR